MAFQDRLLLLLDENPALSEIKDILKSPLLLARELVKSCFNPNPQKGILKYESELDEIKKRAAGISRAKSLTPYKVAEYSPYLFAFHQFFQSSYRARQGNVLDKIIYRCLLSADANPMETKTKMKKDIQTSFGIRENVTADIDFYANKSGKILIGQTRSTDLTGGTTAKASLVDLLKFILDKKMLNPETSYFIVVWEPLLREQRPSLINKIWETLQIYIGTEHEEQFKRQIDRGWQIRDRNIKIQLIYGIDDFGDELNTFCENNIAKNKLTSLWNSLQRWDDLWLSYAIASLELDTLISGGIMNFEILNRKMTDLELTISGDDIKNYENASSEIADKVSKIWTEDTLPVSTAADQQNYIRDLILLKMIDIKVK